MNESISSTLKSTVTSRQAARALGIRPVDVSRLILSGALREIKMPVVRRRVPKADVERLLAERA